MSKNTKHLIDELSDDLTPWQSLYTPIKISCLWVLALVAYIGGVVAIADFRFDIIEKWDDVWFKFEMIWLILIVAVSSYGAFLIRLPQHANNQWIQITSYGSVLIFIAFLFAQKLGFIVPEIIGHTHHTISCFVEICGLSIVPISCLFWIIKRGAAFQCNTSALLSSIAASHTAYIILRLIESNDEIMHLLIWHYIPFLCISIVALFLAKKILTQ